MAALSRPRFQSSDLSRHTARVFAAAEDHPVDVTRRDGEDFVLMTKREAKVREELLHFASQIIAATTDCHGTLAERMSRVFPWMLSLSSQDRVLCASELVDAARASFSTHQPHLAIAQMTAWRETAIATAAGLGEAPIEWLTGAQPVERP